MEVGSVLFSPTVGSSAKILGFASNPFSNRTNFPHKSNLSSTSWSLLWRTAIIRLWKAIWVRLPVKKGLRWRRLEESQQTVMANLSSSRIRWKRFDEWGEPFDGFEMEKRKKEVEASNRWEKEIWGGEMETLEGLDGWESSCWLSGVDLAPHWYHTFLLLFSDGPTKG